MLWAFADQARKLAIASEASELILLLEDTRRSIQVQLLSGSFFM
jgi:hypothetical protein